MLLSYLFPPLESRPSFGTNFLSLTYRKEQYTLLKI